MAKKLTDDRMDMGVPIRERYERFCVRFVETRNPMHAYRTAFVTDRSAVVDWVHDQSKRLLADPEIAARVQELRDAAAERTLVSVQELLQDYHDIIVADPNEIVSYIKENCRHCHGTDHAYQWKDVAEYTAALDESTKMHTTPPDMTGGFGFNPTFDPAPHCPQCFGEGHGRTILHDTRRLSPQARKLYEGLKETANGVEVKLADKSKAREALGRMLGAFKDGVPVIQTQPAKEAAKPVTVEDAAKGYLRLVQGGKA